MREGCRSKIVSVHMYDCLMATAVSTTKSCSLTTGQYAAAAAAAAAASAASAAAAALAILCCSVYSNGCVTDIYLMST